MGVQHIVKKHIQRNAYLSEPGVMLLSMLESEEKDIRVKAIEIIQKNRSRPQMSPKSKILQGIRKFGIPQLQWKANSWDNLINWEMAKIHQPFILEKVTDLELEGAIENLRTFLTMLPTLRQYKVQ